MSASLKSRWSLVSIIFLFGTSHICLFAQTTQKSVIEDVSAEDVKKFLDPTVMNDVLEYRFQANFLPQNTKLFSHRPYVGYSLNHWSAVWAEVPYWHFSTPGTHAPSGISDTLIGGGVVPYKDLSKRFTAVAFWLEALAPTGSAEKGTGFDTWVLSPGGGIALNPTDKFPIYMSGRYLHSFKPIGGLDDSDPEKPARKVRSIELEIQTVHILPKGFFVSALPRFLFDLNQDFTMFALGVGVGRALNRRLMVTAGYQRYAAGRKTFNQAFVVGFSFIWGKEKVKAQTIKNLSGVKPEIP
jgi:hypothetical protein